jgi:hypothetical protein
MIQQPTPDNDYTLQIIFVLNSTTKKSSIEKDNNFYIAAIITIVIHNINIDISIIGFYFQLFFTNTVKVGFTQVF